VTCVLESVSLPVGDDRDGAPRASPWSPKTGPTYANGAEVIRCGSTRASVGHPPSSEIRRSMIDPSPKRLLAGVSHSPTANAVVFCVGG
jgi:hypothetical protein